MIREINLLLIINLSYKRNTSLRLTHRSDKAVLRLLFKRSLKFIRSLHVLIIKIQKNNVYNMTDIRPFA